MPVSRWLPWIVPIALVCVTAVSAIAVAATRTWTDSTGKHEVEADFVKLEDGKVTLRRADGVEIILPLERLSERDRKLAERLAAKDMEQEGPSDTVRDPRSDKEQVEATVVKFFQTLQDTSRTGIRDLLTEAARSRYDAGQSPVQELPAPDRGRLRASRVNVTGDTATADVTVRLRGQYQRTSLQLRRESNAWLVYAISAPGPGGEMLTINFEGEGTAAPGGDAAVAAEITVPDGDPRELLAFIEQAMKTDLRSVASQEEAEAKLRQIFAAVLTTSEKILESDATLGQKKEAAGHKLRAIQGLTALDVPGMAERLASFATELDELGLAELKPLVETFVLTSQLQNYRSLSQAQAKKLIEQAVEHLQTAEFGAQEAQLAQAASDIAEMIDGEFAADVNKKMARLMAASGDESLQALAERMLGKARRLGLVGNRMELAGVMLDGTPFNLSQYEGKVVLVDFWATWCGPCMAEMPNIRRNYEIYNSKGFEVVAVSVDRDLDALTQYVQKETPPWTVLADYHPQISDEQRTSAYYGITGIPTTILVGADGKVISLSCRGEQLGTLLKRLLGPAS